MAIVRETLVYDGPGGPFEGVIAYDDEVEAARPGVLVIPNVLGQKESDNQKAEALAALGYVAFACDVYGQGRRKAPGSADYADYMNELDADRGLLRDRLAASVAVLKDRAAVDPTKTAAIGFCFGGKCALDLARSGQDVLGVVSFHGVYDRPDYDDADPIRAKILVCHGWDDPLGTPDQVTALADELTDAGADWQLHAYGHAGHAFTDLALKDRPAPRPGVGYDAHADRRSWQAMKNFLTELFV
ncbi:dienelactone hydrolase family protein [Sphingomonas oligophenolica]|uniref:Dienelactone hydrolase family protein n=1 Tax=Sphingomonas oligophenolica TaxID=301154 RepID=A0A502CC64_9SPHN|nr:dienelactone hydrolase family protein [Sphingomonas oligophenolica]TPG10413.1 dienelactone hydrolase family protein [Sphingomonas oligophenolica]